MAPDLAAAPGTTPTKAESPASSALKHATLQEVLEDLSSRFIVNLPSEELASIERICFQVEQAHWFYEDFLRSVSPSLPSFALRRFSSLLLHTASLHLPIIAQYLSSGSDGREDAFDKFLKYKTRVPVCGCILLDETWTKCLLVKGWKSSSAWGFPKGKINQDEPERDCACREVLEETGFDPSPLLPPDSPDFIELTIKEQKVRLYIVPGVPENTSFKTLTRKEISKISWFRLADLPTWKKSRSFSGTGAANMGGKFYLIPPFIGRLKQWMQANKRTHPRLPSNRHKFEHPSSSAYDADISSAAIDPGAEALDGKASSDEEDEDVSGQMANAQDASEALKALLGLDSSRSNVPPSPGVVRPAAASTRAEDPGGVNQTTQLLALLSGSNAVPQPKPPSAFEDRGAADQTARLRALLSGPNTVPHSRSPSAFEAPSAADQTAQLRAYLSGPNTVPHSRQPSALEAPSAANQTAQLRALLSGPSTVPQSGPPSTFVGGDPSPAEERRKKQMALLQGLDAALSGAIQRPVLAPPPPPPQQQQQQHHHYYPEPFGSAPGWGRKL